jgi:hypothetical protein
MGNAPTGNGRDISGRLNQAARRIRVFENEDQWCRAFVDATEGFCGSAALFIVNRGVLQLQCSRGIGRGSKVDNIPLDAAPAFAAAVESRDTIVALRTRGELSEAIADLVVESVQDRFYLFPICGRGRVLAILYAASEIDPNALELLSTLASAVLENQASTPDRSQLVNLSAPAAAVDYPGRA